MCCYVCELFIVCLELPGLDEHPEDPRRRVGVVQEPLREPRRHERQHPQRHEAGVPAHRVLRKGVANRVQTTESMSNESQTKFLKGQGPRGTPCTCARRGARWTPRGGRRGRRGCRTS